MAGTILDALNARLTELASKRVKRFGFPGWPAGTLTVRLKPVDTAVTEEITKRISGEDRRDKTVATQAAIVAAATVEIGFEGRTFTLKEFASEIGMADADAGDVIRHLAVAEGDVKSLSDTVLDLGGYLDSVTELEGE